MLERQCIDQRFSTREEVAREVMAWEAGGNSNQYDDSLALHHH
jgi:hypothetical protein